MKRCTLLWILTFWATQVMANEIQVKPGKQTENWLTIEQDGNESKIPFLLFTPKDYSPSNKKTANAVFAWVG